MQGLGQGDLIIVSSRVELFARGLTSSMQGASPLICTRSLVRSLYERWKFTRCDSGMLDLTLRRWKG